MMIALAVWAVAPALAGPPDCPAPAPGADWLVERLAAAQASWVELDVDRFRAVLGEVDAGLGCLAEEVGRHQAAELHRAEGLRAFLERDLARAEQAFASARAIEPTYRFPASVVPEGNPALAAYGAVDPDSGDWERVPVPEAGRVQLDGAVDDTRPLGRPTVLQRFDGDGRVVDTAYVWAGEALPTYPVRSEAAPEPGPVGAPAPMVQLGADRRLAWGAVAAGAVTAGLYAGAYVANRRYYDAETPQDRLDALRTTTNGLVVGSGFGFAATVGLATGAVLSGRF